MEEFFGNLTGSLIDLTFQMFATFFLAAGTAPIIRGEFGLVPLLFLCGGLALMALLVRRVLRVTYILSLGTPRVNLPVNTGSIPYFVLDLAWLAFGVTWLHGSLTAPASLDPAYDYGGPAVVLLAALPLLCLRVWTRLHQKH